MSDWHLGNADVDGQAHRGWIVGNFIAAGGVRRTDAVEIKWGVHPAGDERAAWQSDEQRTAVLILVEGRFRIDLSTGSQVLERPGDYAVWGPGVGHSWRAEEDSIVITVRWPSIPSE